MRYSIHDRATVNLLVQGQLGMNPFFIPGATASAENRYRRKFFGVSKYQPHQGKRECARRVRRMH